jgi:hypothetical protein
MATADANVAAVPRAGQGSGLDARFDSLVEAVQANCHITDARHARNMTMCTYLLEMRELYRWELGAAPTAALPRADVGPWIARREASWAAFEEAEYRGLPLNDGIVDPFDVEAVNRSLVPCNLVYGAGIGRFGKPQFFLGELAREEWRDGVRILIAQREYARDLAPAPAALRQGTIYVRAESLRQVLWERAEAWGRRRAHGALECALDAHGFHRDPAAALESMVEAETETLILHELGEHAAGVSLSAAWERMVDGFAERRAELFARAVRDHLADCAVTLPTLVARGASASIHLWFAGLDGLRRELFPRACSAYDCWRRGNDGRALVAAAADGTLHWKRVCDTVLALAASGGSDAERALAALVTAGATRL